MPSGSRRVTARSVVEERGGSVPERAVAVTLAELVAAMDEFRKSAGARSASAALLEPSRRRHEPGPPPLSARHSREVTNVGVLEEAPTAIIGGFDVHRTQITFDA